MSSLWFDMFVDRYSPFRTWQVHPLDYHNFHFCEKIRWHEAVALMRKNVCASETAILYLTNHVRQRAEALLLREMLRSYSHLSKFE